jgi:hypothetical protein
VAAGQAGAWQRVIAPTTVDDRRHHRLLWDDAREAKESLSRQNRVSFPLPVVGGDVMVTRDEFEAMVRPLLTRTVAETLAAIGESRVGVAHVAGLFLVGGGSRIPLAATLLHQRCGIAPTALEQPELVVADGALTAVSARTSQLTRPASPASPVAAVSGPPPVPAPPRVGTPLPPEQVWPSAPPTEPPRLPDQPARSGPRRPQRQPQEPPTPTRPPVWPAQATGDTGPHRGRRPPKLVWVLVLLAIVALITARFAPAPAVGVFIVGLIGLLVVVAARRRRKLRR